MLQERTSETDFKKPREDIASLLDCLTLRGFCPFEILARSILERLPGRSSFICFRENPSLWCKGVPAIRGTNGFIGVRPDCLKQRGSAKKGTLTTAGEKCMLILWKEKWKAGGIGVKKIVYPFAGLIVESLVWMSALFIWSQYLTDAIAAWLGEAYWNSFGAAARPYMVLYFLVIFLLLTLCVVLMNRLKALKSHIAVTVLTGGNLLWLGYMLFYGGCQFLV